MFPHISDFLLKHPLYATNRFPAVAAQEATLHTVGLKCVNVKRNLIILFTSTLLYSCCQLFHFTDRHTVDLP